MDRKDFSGVVPTVFRLIQVACVGGTVRGSSWLKSSSFNHLWAKLWQRKPLYPPPQPRLQHRPAGGKVRWPCSPLKTS